MPSLPLQEDAAAANAAARFPVTLQFIDIYYRIKLAGKQAASGGTAVKRMLCFGTSTEQMATRKERTILHGVTGTVSPGEMLAILGPSGSGKSTLLNILAGRLQGRHAGAVLANGHRLTKADIRRTGFVPQDDILYPHLTVRETLVFAALLRLPRTLTTAEKVEAAEAVIAELGLAKCADTIVGSAYVRGVSGGERRRVSIGKEVVVDPSVLILDEPTSGLDATAAQRVVAALGAAAREKGRAVVAAVHQPASRAYQAFDSVLLLSSEGRCLYFGPGNEAMDYFAAAGFSPRFHVNPADFMLDLANGIAPVESQVDADKSNVIQSLLASYNKSLAPTVKACVSAAAAKGTIQIGTHRRIEKEQIDYCSISWFSQFAILLRRSLKERRYESFNSLRIFQVMCAAFLAGAMWWRSSIRDIGDRLGLLFFISIFWGVFASFNSVFTFPQERAIFIKERASGMYSLSSYFMARAAGDLPMELILPTIFVLILYWMAGLRPEPGAFALTLTVILGYVLVAQGLGLALGAAIMDAKQASTVATITMLAFLLTGGFYVQNVPSGMTWLKYTSFTYYCYRLLIGVQYKESEVASYMRLYQEEQHAQASNMVSVAALVIMFVGYRVLAYAALRRIKI